MPLSLLLRRAGIVSVLPRGAAFGGATAVLRFWLFKELVSRAAPASARRSVQTSALLSGCPALTETAQQRQKRRLLQVY